MLGMIAVEIVVAFFMSSIAVTSFAQEKPASRTVWDGVYTTEQAERGRLEYVNHCQRCHGVDLADGREITGEKFMERWREDRLDPLFNYLKTAMPRLNGGSLSDDVYIDIFSYVLARNGFPAGSETLTIPQLANIELFGKDGPQPVPDGAIIATVGCMKRGPGNQWLLTQATEPKRNRTPYDTTQDELRAAQASPAGPHTFILTEFDAIRASRPENFDGLRLQAKGFLVRAPGAERISLFHLGLISAKCP